MCAAFSSNNKFSQGPPSGFGNGYGYPQPPQGYGPGPGYGYNAPPPSYNSHFHNPYPSPAPSHSPQPPFGSNHPYNAPQSYPNEKPNMNGYQQAGEKASYYGHPIPPRSHGPSPVPGHGHGYAPGPAPGPGPAGQALAPPMHGRAHSNSAPPGPPIHPQQLQQGPPRSLLLRQSPKTHKIILIHPSGQPSTAPPLYSLTSSPKSSKADYVLARGADPNDASQLVGEVKSHTFSSKYDLIVRGTPCTLKESGGGSNYNIEIPGMGKYKWVTDMENLSSNMKLTDEGKSITFARYGKSSEKSSVGTWKKFVGGKDRELVLDRPVSEFFTEVLLVSLYAVKMAKEGALEAAGEIVGAVAGA
ncbi:uncharacterized protein BDV14DRAFT_126265 [Aspergillus stella-maris]|uniref:uncharacterized protein n=1 Tax=Aspergillus stella-maris TaxID=1810926 RepID=UPI003CCCDE17